MSDKILVTIGKNTRRWRMKRNLTQSQLAKKVKMHPSYISKIENAKINIFLTTLVRIAKGLKIAPKDLVK